MERGKMGSAGRGAKSKAPQHPQDIFALGTKTTVVVPRDSEKRSIHKPTTSGVGDRKREASTFGAPPPGKKSRIGSPAESVGGTSLEVDPVDLVPHVLQALDTHNSDKLLGLLTGSIRLLKSQRSKPDPILCMSMLYLTKIRPNMFAHETVMQSLCSLLKREQGAAFKNKGNPLVFVLACNMLYAGHREHKNWPDAFIKVYIEDALNERCWVECVWCKCLVENVVTAFNTRRPPAHLIPTDTTLGTMSPSGSGSPLMGSTEEEVDNSELDYSVFSRYSGSYEAVEGLVLEAIKEQLQRRVAPDAIGKGFLKLLAATCGFPEIRIISASRLEAWLHSGKLWRAAQELLAHVCLNADPSRDHEVLAQLARMRLKTKPLVNAYIACLREMVSESGALLRSVVTHTMYNELSNVRSPNNMAVLGALALAQPHAVPQAMADTYIELLLRQEDYLRPLRALSRELASRGRDCTALPALARQLAQALSAPPPQEIRERMFNSLVDLFCALCMIVAIHGKQSPDFKQMISAIQCAALGWLLESAPPVYRHNVNYRHALHKIMFLEPADSYSKVDNWPAESERALAHRACCEAPLLQTQIMTIVFIGLNKDIGISPGEVVEVLESCVRRACALPAEDSPLVCEQEDLPECLLQLAQFHPPDNVVLPQGYTPPSLAITSLYWRVWSTLVLICAHNPGLARTACRTYPTLPALIETAITTKPSQEWSDPTPAEAEAERAAILQLESHLAAASNSKQPVTEHNCRLLSQLTTFDPTGPARKPPAAVIEALQQSSSTLRLSRLLCRQPALLLQLTQQHGVKRAMPWLQRLLRHERLQLSALPVQCLCEFLSCGLGWEGACRVAALAAHLRAAVRGGPSAATAVLGYYTQRLPAPTPQARANAHRGLKIVLSPSNEEVTEADFTTDVGPESWLELARALPHWPALEADVVSRVRAACLVESVPEHLATYIAFLPTCNHADETQVLLELSHVIMERSTVSGYMLGRGGAGAGAGGAGGATPAQHRTLHALTTMFYNYMIKVRTSPSPPAVPAEGAGVTTVCWRDGRTVALPALLVHAQLKLLCCGPSNLDTNQTMYKYLERTWVGPDAPIDPDESLLPDWLRLHLVRSANPPLLAAGLAGLPASKLALFIQTFGMPVASMSALLSALDRSPAGAVSRLCVERGYMSSLLAVQWARGARGGDAFAAALALHLQHTHHEDESLFSQPELPAEPAGAWRGAPAPLAPAAPAPAIPPAQLLANMFCGEGNVVTGDQLANLLQKVTEESTLPSRPYTSAVLSFLESTVNNKALTTSLLSRQLYSAPLLRAMIPHKRGADGVKLTQVCHSLLDKLGSGRGPLVDTLREITNDKRNNRRTTPKQSREQLIAALESVTPATLEEIGSSIIEGQEPELLVDVITHILDKSQGGGYEIKSESGAPAHVFSSSGGGCGLLLDWISVLQQHTSDDNLYRQMRVMFSSSGSAWRALSVSLLEHRAPRAALHATLANLLAGDGAWSPSGVLNFVFGIEQAECRDAAGRRRPPARARPAPPTLALTHTQISSLVWYIIREASEASDLEGMRARITRRLPLLLRVCGDDAQLLSAARAPSADTPRDGGGRDASLMYLLLFYMQVPRIQQLLAESAARWSPESRRQARGNDALTFDRQLCVVVGLRGVLRQEGRPLRRLLPAADLLRRAMPPDFNLLNDVYREAVNGNDGRPWRDDDEQKTEEGERRRRGRQRPKPDETEAAWKSIVECISSSQDQRVTGAGAARVILHAVNAAVSAPKADCGLPKALHHLVNRTFN